MWWWSARGNAALCAALAAREHGAEVAGAGARAARRARRQHAASPPARSASSTTASRTCSALMPDLTDERDRAAPISAPTPRSSSSTTWRGSREYRSDPDLVRNPGQAQPADACSGCATKGVRFAPIYGRQAFKVDGKFKFWGGLTVEAVGRRARAWSRRCTPAPRANGIEIALRARARCRCSHDDERRARRACASRSGETRTIRAKAVVLACRRLPGQRRVAHALPRPRLGPRQGARHALQHRRRHPHGARRRRAAATATGRAATPSAGTATRRSSATSRSATASRSTPIRSGVMVNADGERFVDEGADFRNYTYAKYGRVILEQPGQFAWQIFDAKVAHLLRDEYRIRQVTKVSADTLEELVAQARRRRSAKASSTTLKEYNAAVTHRRPVQSERQGRPRHRAGWRSPRSNWANTLDTPPFEAYAVTCGITFTFGGLRIDDRRRRCSTPTARRSPASTPPASWSAGCSTSTIPAAPA